MDRRTCKTYAGDRSGIRMVEAREKPGTVTHTNRFTEADEDSAKARAKSNSKEAERDRGGGTITINGDPTAQAEAMCVVSGIRPGINGTYRITSAEHRLDRSSGYTTTLEVKQPSGDAGTDSRKAGKE